MLHTLAVAYALDNARLSVGSGFGHGAAAALCVALERL
jgi:hypothetical protein